MEVMRDMRIEVFYLKGNYEDCDLELKESTELAKGAPITNKSKTIITMTLGNNF